MNPLSTIFGIAARTRSALYDRGLLRQRPLQGPVVSVGNLSVGGTGKTPFVILLGELLKSRAMKFDILSRGYRRKSQTTSLVNENGSPRDYGDEPLLLARRLQVPIIVGADRYRAGLFAEERFGPQLHLLDDGFQHRRLHRNFDIVLVSQDDFTDTLLPIGRLREPLQSLQRADVIVITNDHSSNHSALLARVVPGKTVWSVRRGIQLENVPPRPLVFCGIARPKSFVSQLRASGIEPSAHAFFRDHRAYTNDDVDNLLRLRDKHCAEGFLTTEKDVINLQGLASALQPLAIAKVTMHLEDSDNALDTMLRIIAERRQRT
ncbi:MAG: tetraacyldisaccharide 4'-kinase [Acidobacteriota bacterium]|nr:tetraacyldisaccharide 4'-kinase [Acidobacteriota bacterium]